MLGVRAIQSLLLISFEHTPTRSGNLFHPNILFLSLFTSSAIEGLAKMC